MITETLLQAGRVTRYLPWLRGLELVRRVYAKTIPRPDGWTMRIEDFDGDLKLEVDPREFMGITLWHKPEIRERRERDLFCAAIRPGSVVLDVGANIGIYSLLAAKRGARVFAFEADPKNAARLRHHVALNGFDSRVTIHEMAALDGEGSVNIYRNPNNCGGSSCFRGEDGTQVPAGTIDSLNLPPVEMCKMDIEGSESRALMGMRETIVRSPRFKLCIEYNPTVGDGSALMHLLHATFRQVRIIGGRVLETGETPEKFCDLYFSDRLPQFNWNLAA
jgi:FkbM family methyltransferase